MGDIMTQEEIDALFQSMSGGGAAVVPVAETQKKYKPYDFRHPQKFNKEQLRTLENMHDNYCRLLSSFLTGYLRTQINIDVASAEQVTYLEFLNTLSNPVILAILEFSPMKGSIILEISANIGFAIIDRILGGPGLGLGATKLRDFTEIEKILLERVISQMLTFLPETWANIGDFKPRIQKIETNSQFAQIIQPSYMTALVTLTLKVGAVDGFMNFCLPHVTIEPIVDKLNTKSMYSMSAGEETLVTYTDDIVLQLEKAQIPISAVIGKTRITVDDFIGLQVGDIIALDSYVNSDVNIMVGPLLKFRAKPGLKRGKNAVQITSVVRKDEG